MKKRARKMRQAYVCVFILLSFSGFIFAQYRFDSWTTDEGLPQNSVTAIIQSQDGYIWGVTKGGIFRFDGVRFKVFNKSNTKGLNESRFLHLKEDGDGRIWFLSTSHSITKFENGQFTPFTKGKDYLSNITNPFFMLDSDGNLILSTDKGYYRYLDNKFIRFEIPGSSSPSFISFIDKAGGFWITEKETKNTGKNRKIRRVFEGKIEDYFFPPEDYGEPVFFEDCCGSIWIIFWGSAPYRVRQGKLQYLRQFSGVFSITDDSDGNLYMLRRQGFTRIDVKTIEKEQIESDETKNFETTEDFDEVRRDALLVDLEKGGWIGTFNSGLIHASPQIFKVYSKKEWQTENSIVYPIFEDKEKNVWVGTWSNAIIKYDLDNDFRILNPYKTLEKKVTSLFEDSNRRMWVGTINEFGYFENGKFANLFSDTIFAMAEDENGNLLLGGDGGFVRYNGENFERFTTADGVTDNYVTSILKITNDKFWVGTRKGLSVYSGGKFVTEEFQNELKNDHIRSLYKDAEDVVWIGTYDDGLIRYKNGQIKRIKKKDGLFHENVFCTLEDDNGWFWINTNNGIYRVKKQQLNDFANGKISRVESIAYNKKDGLLTLEGNGEKQPAGIRRSNGELWFPTQEGVAIVNPNEISVNRLPPPVRIEEIFIDKKELENPGEEIEIKPGQNNLEINYTGLSLINSELVKFRYQLEGLEENWNEAGTRRTAFYNNIPPGEYTFRVLAANRDGIWNNQGATIKVIKLPHFYQTWWFLILSVLAVIGIISWVVYLRISRLKMIAATKSKYSKNLIASQEAERKRLASELHDGLGQDLIVIKNRAFLAKRNRQDESRLDKELDEITETAIRTLESVREITTGLRPQMLDKMGLTLAINSLLRKFSGVLEIKSEIDSIDGLFSEDEEINIYRIIQESINNIVKHSGAAEAFLAIKNDGKNVKITIEDDGRGFNTADAKTKKSDGLGLIGLKERTESLQGNFSINSGKGKGTTVLITIPIDKNTFSESDKNE